MDSKLVVEQMSGRWQVRHPAIRPLAQTATELAAGFPQVRFRWVPRAGNTHADRLANAAMDAAAQGRAWEPAIPQAPDPTPRPAPTKNRLSGWMAPPAPPTTTVLLRHGQTALSVEKRFSGLGDAPLTPGGVAQARAVADRLRGARFDAVFCSPLRRARQTAELLGQPYAVDEGLRETDFGAWEGLTFAEVRERWPEELSAWLTDPQVAPPGGESFAATDRRVRAARDRAVAAHPTGTVLLVSHVTPIKSLTRLALDAAPGVLYRLHLDLTALTTIDWYDDGPAVLRGFNDTAHLTSFESGE